MMAEEHLDRMDGSRFHNNHESGANGFENGPEEEAEPDFSDPEDFVDKISDKGKSCRLHVAHFF